METKYIIYIIFTFIISIALAGFQYFYKVKKTSNKDYFLFALKFLTFFFIGVLLINPKLKTLVTENIKPKLSVLLDDSKSISNFKAKQKLINFVDDIKLNSAINDKFDITFYSFSDKLKPLSSLSCNKESTNIHKALKANSNLLKDNLGATILATDGNQTFGSDYVYHKSKAKLYPFVIGDTINYEDIKISQVNVNKYSYVKNKFPVEILLHYDGKEAINSNLVITKAGKKVFSKPIKLNGQKNTTTITANLTSAKAGLKYYSVYVQKLKNEKNTRNNLKSFSVEVIDEQSKVLILASILHPDLGALKKAIQSNQQRKVDLQLVDDFKGNVNDYQVVVYYQPNYLFKQYFEKRKSNFILISGKKTDWNFVNNLNLGFNKSYINQFENYTAIYNPNFLSFIQQNINFSDFPPLSDKFGEVTFNVDKQDVLFQKILGIQTKNSLISTLNKNGKIAVIFGEGIWKWRATHYREKESFEQFDKFINNLVQYAASNKKRERLSVDLKRVYPANSDINISAMYLDENYTFDSRASLKIEITNTTTKLKKTYPFSLKSNSYQLAVNGLEHGEFTYKVSVGGQNIAKYGRFKITKYNIEDQFISANTTKLEKLASSNNSKLYFENQTSILINDLLQNKELYITQKSSFKEQSLINWKWLLYLIVALLSMEWFVRKYFGKI